MLYFVSFNFLCILLVLIALLFKNNQKELCHPVYDQAGCMVFGKVIRFGISMTRPRGRWPSLAFVSLQGEAPPRVTALYPEVGGLVWITLSSQTWAETTAFWLNVSLKRSHTLFGKKEINKATPEAAAFSWACPPAPPRNCPLRREGGSGERGGELRGRAIRAVAQDAFCTLALPWPQALGPRVSQPCSVFRTLQISSRKSASYHRNLCLVHPAPLPHVNLKRK